MMQFHLVTEPSRERLLYYYGALRERRVRPSAHTYKLLLDAYSSLPPMDLPKMESVFDELCRDTSVSVQGTHWAALITGYGIHGNDLEKALQIFDSIPSHPTTKDPKVIDPVVFEAVLNVTGNKGTLSEMESLNKRMAASGARPTAYVYNVLISGYAKAGQIVRAREVFESMGDGVTGVAAPNNHPLLMTSSGHAKPTTRTPARRTWCIASPRRTRR